MRRVSSGNCESSITAFGTWQVAPPVLLSAMTSATWILNGAGNTAEASVIYKNGETLLKFYSHFALSNVSVTSVSALSTDSNSLESFVVNESRTNDQIDYTLIVVPKV